MGQGGSKDGSGKPPKPGTDAWWWVEANKTLAPITSPDDFCKRFNTSMQECEKVIEFFKKLGAGCPKDAEGIPHLTLEAFSKVDEVSLPELDKLHKMVFDAFDTDKNGFMSLAEFLLYMGIKLYGTLEQRTMGAFFLYDTDHDHKIRRSEMIDLITAVYACCKKLDPERFRKDLSGIPDVIDSVFHDVDTDRNGTLELREVIEATRKDENFAQIFKLL